MGFQGLARLRSQAFCRPSRFPLGLVCTSLSPWAHDPGLGAAPALTWPPHRASTPSPVHTTTTTTPADPRARCSYHLASAQLAPLALRPAPSPAALPVLRTQTAVARYLTLKFSLSWTPVITAELWLEPDSVSARNVTQVSPLVLRPSLPFGDEWHLALSGTLCRRCCSEAPCSSGGSQMQE